ncbi:hypothetical protein Tco_0406509, partial [Tanacetum coccineum]
MSRPRALSLFVILFIPSELLPPRPLLLPRHAISESGQPFLEFPQEPQWLSFSGLVDENLTFD